MKIKVICLGKLKEKYLVEGIKEYTKRISRFSDVEIIELNDEKIPDKPSAGQEVIVKDKEGQKILDKIKDDDYVFVLDVQGKQRDSEGFASEIEQCMVNGKSTLVFVIGGSLGHGQAILNRANTTISFSKMTFPHQLMRLILMEQIYRCFKIIHHETYHK